MQSQSNRWALSARRLRGLAVVAALMSSLALAGAAFVAPAGAGAQPTQSIVPPTSVTQVSPTEVEVTLATAPLGKINAVLLAEALSKLPGLGTLPSKALTGTIENLAGKGATLGQLLTPGEVISTLESQLSKLLSLPELLNLLKGQTVTGLLNSALGSLNLQERLGTLLSSAPKPEQLVGQVLAALTPTQLEKLLLGSTLTGHPFEKLTVNELAGQLGTTGEALAKDLGKTVTETSTALTAPLTDGKILGVLPNLGGLSLNLLGSGQEPGASEKGGSGEGKGSTSSTSSTSEGKGGSGGSSGSPGGIALTVNDFPQPTAGTSASRTAAAGKIKLISHRVHGRVVTVVVQVPSAGKASLGGRGIRSVRLQAAKAERLTLRTTLTRAGVASLRKHHRHLKLTLKAGFKQTAGPSSSVTFTVSFA